MTRANPSELDWLGSAQSFLSFEPLARLECILVTLTIMSEDDKTEHPCSECRIHDTCCEKKQGIDKHLKRSHWLYSSKHTNKLFQVKIYLNIHFSVLFSIIQLAPMWDLAHRLYTRANKITCPSLTQAKNTFRHLSPTSEESKSYFGRIC